MFPKRSGTPIQCYLDGKKLGEKTPLEWADEIGVKVQTIYAGKSSGGNVVGADGKRYKFYRLGVDPVKIPVMSLSDKEAEARAQGKSYGQLQAEETLAMMRETAEAPQNEDREEDMEIIDKTVKPAEIAQETKKDILLSDFAKLADETTIIVYQGEQWILTAPSDSPIFESLKWFIDSFRAGMMDGTPIMKVTVWN